MSNNKENQFKEMVEKMKEVKETKVEVLGLTEHEASIVNETLEIIKMQSVDKIEAELKRQSYIEFSINENINLYKDILKVFKVNNIKNDTYKKIKAEIEELEKELEQIKKPISQLTKLSEFASNKYEEIKTHIKVSETFNSENEKVVVYQYDRDYFLPFLDLATILLPLKSVKITGDENNEEKTEVVS